MKRLISALLATTVSVVVLSGSVLAQEGQEPVRIMVMSDQSGPYATNSGLGGVAATRMASSELGDTVLGRPVMIMAGNHQNKPDVGLALARKFYTDQNGGAIIDIGNSAISLAVQELARSLGKVVIHVGSAHADLYGKACSPTAAVWLYDTVSLSRTLVKAVTGLGLRAWFFVAADYSAGAAMVADETTELKASGPRVHAGTAWDHRLFGGSSPGTGVGSGCHLVGDIRAGCSEHHQTSSRIPRQAKDRWHHRRHTDNQGARSGRNRDHYAI